MATKTILLRRESMKVNEKSLELNVGAELLAHFRGQMKKPKAYLQGLTQIEEWKDGADFFLNLPRNTRLFAFQFKAPKKRPDALPYKFKLDREQHESLYRLSKPKGVFYVLPFYCFFNKLIKEVPNLSKDTWLLNVRSIDTVTLFKKIYFPTAANKNIKLLSR